jgi:hypothetical protein
MYKLYSPSLPLLGEVRYWKEWLGIFRYENPLSGLETFNEIAGFTRAVSIPLD